MVLGIQLCAGRDEQDEQFEREGVEGESVWIV